MPGDITPELVSEEDDNVTEEPVGDIAELTMRVSEHAATPGKLASQPTSARVRVFSSQKNKGVGKGCSGSSGPPPAKKKTPATSTASRRPAEDTSSEESSANDDDDDDTDAVIGATQTITVGGKRGYTFYPSYLFDVPPKKLKTDTLRKKLMISEIKRSETQTQFYERGMILMGHLKEFLSHLRMSGTGAGPSTSNKEGYTDHDYTLNNNDEDEDKNTEN